MINSIIYNRKLDNKFNQIPTIIFKQQKLMCSLIHQRARSVKIKKIRKFLKINKQVILFKNQKSPKKIAKENLKKMKIL